MINLIKKLFSIMGLALGRLCSFVYSGKVEYVIYIFSRAFFTGLYKNCFGSFGSGSVLAKDVQLIKPHRIFIGNNVSIMKGAVLGTVEHGTIQFGNNVSLGEYSHITAKGKIKIGNNLLTGRYILISDNSHGSSTFEDMQLAPIDREIVSKGDIEIGDNVWLGDRVTVLGGVKIGNGAIIGANSVVTRDIPCYSVATGVPAKVIKQNDLEK